MRLTDGWKSSITKDGETVNFFFRNPTNEETNEFMAKRFEVKEAGQIADNSPAERAALFDKLLVRVENLEGVDGTPIAGPDRSAEIPAEWKGPIIFKRFEDFKVNEKN